VDKDGQGSLQSSAHSLLAINPPSLRSADLPPDGAAPPQAAGQAPPAPWVRRWGGPGGMVGSGIRAGKNEHDAVIRAGNFGCETIMRTFSLLKTIQGGATALTENQISIVSAIFSAISMTRFTVITAIKSFVFGCFNSSLKHCGENKTWFHVKDTTNAIEIK